MKFRISSHPEQEALWREFLKDKNDFKARERLAESYGAFVQSLVSKYVDRRTLDRQDLFQEAWIALMRAIDSYDPNRNVMFTSFATPVIRNDLGNYSKKEYKVETGTISLDGLGKELGHGDQVPTENTKLANVIADPSAIKPEIAAIQALLSEAALDALGKLTEEEKRLVLLRTLNKSYREIGDLLNRSHEWARLRYQKVIYALGSQAKELQEVPIDDPKKPKLIGDGYILVPYRPNGDYSDILAKYGRKSKKPVRS